LLAGFRAALAGIADDAALGELGGVVREVRPGLPLAPALGGARGRLGEAVGVHEGGVDRAHETRLQGAAVAHPDARFECGHVVEVDGVEPGEGDGVGDPVAGEAPAGLPEWRDVAAVTVDDDDAVPAVAGEARHRLAEVRAEGVLAHPQRPREVAVFLRDADGDGRPDDDLAVVAVDARACDGLGRECVCPQRRVGSVLFGAADGQRRQVGVGGVGVRP
jgi:hypothetical protein